MQRFLALGDSYTIGEGVAEGDRWPNHLAALLHERGIALAPPIICARTAWTTDELSDAIDQANPAGPFDMVSLLIGVNDQYRGRPTEPFAGGFSLLLDRARQLAGGEAGRVLVLSIPDWGATPFAAGRDRELIAREIASYNAIAREATRARGAKWVDVTPSSRDVLEDPMLVVADGLHPSGAMYRRWAELALPFAEAILGGRSG